MTSPQWPAVHDNPAINRIIQQLYAAIATDDLNARASITKYKKGFYAGRADAKRHLISILAQTRI